MTREKWEQLKGKGQWDIQVALRGPDSNYGEVLKWFTTSVIRGQMSEIIRVGGTVNKDLQLVVLPRQGEKPLTEKAQTDFAGPRGWNYHHFVGHIQTACEWLGVPILWIEDVLWHKVMSGSSASDAITKIVVRADEYKAEIDEAAAKGEPLYPWRGRTAFYAPSCIAELIRHQTEGRINL